ncbi:GIN domain-containing protein [Alistipes sp. ZOR0009]|jgi:hypothetical protein|uniref:GIN domain-containing protein n=1 Tax=Alistipes sp. ZOR0009 TaxID=1339253 RepID=UPI000692431F|nr:DUF2807 domain-containing protein [Alistipes sp. ZOR0009]
MKTGIKKSLGLAAAALTVMLAASCTISSGDGGKKVKAEGEMKEKSITTQAFKEVTVTGQATLNVSYGDVQTITLKAQESILDIIEVKSDGKLLTIGVKDGYSISTNKGIVVNVVLPTPVEKYTVAGAAEVNVTGKPQENLNIEVAGAADFNGGALEVKNVTVAIAGAGDCKVWATDNLAVSIAGAGDVKYRGNPVLKKDIAGIGSVKAIE